MAEENKIPDRSADLRRSAEEILLKRQGALDKIPPSDVQRIFHELQVHQIELEMQNDELRRTQLELEATREKYFDLYDLAPVGYVTLNEKGTILEANLTTATLLGKERNDLLRQPLSGFIFGGDQDTYYLHHKRLFETRQRQDCRVRMLKGDGTQFWAGVESVVARVSADVPVSRTAISDITRRKELEEQLQQKYTELRSLSSHIQDAREEERRNITRELHDQLGQNLSVLGINLNTLKTKMPGSDMISHIENSLTLIEQMTESVRDLMADLRPPLLDEYGLAAALRWYAEQFTARTGIEVTSEVHNLDTKIEPRIENTLFRIAQEAINNVAKHAQATHVWVELEMEHPVVRLTISDNGVGFAPRKIQKHDGNNGWGFVTMTERAEEIGGACRIESTPGKGTIVTIEAKL